MYRTATQKLGTSGKHTNWYVRDGEKNIPSVGPETNDKTYTQKNYIYAF